MRRVASGAGPVWAPRPRAPVVVRSVPTGCTTTAGEVGAWRFVGAMVVSCVLCLGMTLALNVVLDPFAIVGTNLTPSAVETDRAEKLTLIQRLYAAPEILILGSSRARQAEPTFLKQLTGHAGFNAGVTGGTAADAWVFTRFTADRFPGATRHYIWFVDAGIAVNGVNPQLAADPRANRYLRGDGGQFGLADIGTYLSLDASRASLRLVKECVIGTCASRVTYEPDGSIPGSRLTNLPEHTRNLEAAAAAMVADIRGNPPRSTAVDPARYEYFERALGFMNNRGERPVIVLNPVFPTVLAELQRYGFPAAAGSLAYLRQLHRRFDFVVVNCQDIRDWGGTAEDFSNPSHVNRLNMRRMLRYVIAHSDGELR